MSKFIDLIGQTLGLTKSCGCLQKEVILRVGISNKGSSRTEESKMKMSISHKGKHLSEEHKNKLSIINTGHKHPQWNPNRELILRNKKTIKAMCSLLHNTLKRTGDTKTTKTEIILGYTKLMLMVYIESKFLPGMSWSNYGKWHIDHIKPVSAFVKEGATDPKIICALENLQPLWAKDNTRKGNKF